MQAVRIHRFGPPEVVIVEDTPSPLPGPHEVLVRVAAAGVAPWDALIREGKSKVSRQPPLTLGSDLAGVVEALGTDVSEFKAGDKVYGVTNPQFCGAQAEHAVASAGMIALKPPSLNDLEAASAPVIAVTAWQMLFEYAQAGTGDTVMIIGAAGNVGAYAVQMAVNAGMHVVAIGRSSDMEMLRKLGAGSVIDSTAHDFEKQLPQVDSILDTVGGATLDRCVNALKYGGRLVSTNAIRPLPQRKDIQAIFFYAEVTTARLRTLTEQFNSGGISTRVGSVLPLAEARRAHEMLGGAAHLPGKIVLRVSQAGESIRTGNAQPASRPGDGLPGSRFPQRLIRFLAPRCCGS